MREGLAVRIGLVFLGALVGVLLVPAAVGAAVSRFTDVSDSSPFVNDIEWLADAGVTKGCNPPANDMYCPSDYVTRQQMAAFMHRQAKYFDADDSGVVDNAEAVAGYAPWDLNAAYALYDDSDWLGFADTAWSVALELEIVPPGDGMVYLTGFVDYGVPDSSGARNLSVMVCTTVRCSPDSWGAYLIEAYDETQVVTTAVLPVDGDGDVLRLWMRAPNLGPIDVGMRSLTALYVPFGFTVDCDSAGVCETIEPGT
jgi:hypothetical protein